MRALVRDVVPALRALLVALAGVILARWWFRDDWVFCGVLVIGLMLLGVSLEWIGERFFLPYQPVAAVLLMEWSVLTPMGVAAAASAAVIIIAVWLTAPETVIDPVVKETTTAFATGLSTFLTAGFVSSVGDRDNSAVGDRIKERLRAHYVRTAPPNRRVLKIQPGSPIEQFLHSDLFQGLSGWDRETRLQRARGIAQELRSPRP